MCNKLWQHAVSQMKCLLMNKLQSLVIRKQFSDRCSFVPYLMKQDENAKYIHIFRKLVKNRTTCVLKFCYNRSNGKVTDGQRKRCNQTHRRHYAADLLRSMQGNSADRKELCITLFFHLQTSRYETALSAEERMLLLLTAKVVASF